MKMKNVGVLLGMAMMGAVLLLETARASEYFPRWVGRLDMGGTIPLDANITEFGGPMGDGKFKLSPGFQMDLALGWRATPWLELGPELGFTFNSVDSIGGWSYPDTTLGQILMMANVRLEYPPKSRLAPFVGAGIGGAASFLTFGGGYNHYDYYYGYYDPAGTGSDFSLAFQFFAGVRYRVTEGWNLGVQYRYLCTDPQHWNVDWWNGSGFGIGIDSLRMHSVCLVFTGEF
jgi:opacity protein-like surface antigen